MAGLVVRTGGACRPLVPAPVEPSAASRWLDRFAAPGVAHLGSTAPAYLTYGVAGLMTGIVTLAAVGSAAGIPVATQVALTVTALAVFVLTGLAQKAVLGRERHVLWENVVLVLGASAAVGAATGLPALLVADCQVVALGAFLAVARAGCLASGCCHGRPAAFGVRYESGLHEDDPLTGVRLFPLPLCEGLALAVATGVGALLATRSPGTGAALAWWLLAYGVVRFFLELARGDTRERWGPLTESQWMLVAVVVALAVREGDTPAAVAGLVAAAVVVTAYAGRDRWLSPAAPEPTPADVGAWQDMLSELERVARDHDHPMAGAAPWAGRTLRVDLAIDPLDGGEELHAYVVHGGGHPVEPQLAAQAGGMVLQGLPAHRLLRVDGCSHDSLALWVAVDPATPRGSRPGDAPHLVVLRARAAAAHLVAVTKALPSARLPRPALVQLDPRLLPPA